MEKYVKVNLVKDLEMDFALLNIQIIQVLKVIVKMENLMDMENLLLI